MKRMIPPLIFLSAFWWCSSLIIDKPFFPTPDLVLFSMLHQFREGALAAHLITSLFRVFAALFFSFFPALILGIAAGRNRMVDSLVSPVVYLLYPVPKVALLPIILLFLGLGNLSKIFFVSLVVFFQFFLNLRDETAGINRQYFVSLRSLGGRKADELRHIIIPALLPRIFSSLRMTLGTAIAILFLAETFATRMGIGWYIMDAWSRIAYTEMYAGILALSLAGFVLFLILDVSESFFCRWKS
ncbi:ABC transporter permease [Oceanispirochaeta sp.]|jgi:NitT/TauT family transport system permease protein|uniref:ABC transporter permease n=1 Tax=Oceanispirochaeta sp. TaxID=2035350 RepID=UPI002624F9A6|nr:ABC transporter permease [Oceanispirochaeta sp.]MDA3956747.1 ABC transporter permease [Oceanispirochaeta sp.]